jgi:GT2 family glycosyltransferase
MSFSTALPRVGVILLCYNGIDLTLNCLDSLYRQDYPQFEVFIVDNNSQDDTLNRVRSKYKQSNIIPLKENLGYAGGNNHGIQAVLARGFDLCFLVNNDTLLAPDCISTLVNGIVDHPEAGIAGPMVHTWDKSGTISSAGGKINWRHADAINIGAGEKDEAQYPARQVDFINGCGIMVTREAIERAGPLDARFFMYWEETDWCMRVQKAGFGIYFEPKAQMQHKATIADVDLNPLTLYYLTRNRFLFFSRHTQYPMKLLTLFSALHGALTGIRKNQQAGRHLHARAMRLAILHAIQQQWGRADPNLFLGKSSIKPDSLSSGKLA